MDDLKAYMLAKLLWDVNRDPKADVADFLQGFYGKAGKPIGQMLDLMHEKVRTENIHGTIWQDPNAPWLTPEMLAEMERLFDEAEKLADNPEILSRVKHARLSLEYVKVFRQVHKAASGTPEEKAAALQSLDAFIAKCKADGITQLAEWCSIDVTYENWAKGLR